MSIKRSASQEYFEKIFMGNNGIPFHQIPNNQYEQTSLTKQQAEDFRNLLEGEIASHYYKALLSYMECIPAINNSLFSWATVKLYYSVYYSLKAYLACNHIAILRRHKHLYYIKAKEKEFFKKCEDGTDHKGTMYTFCKLFKDTDMLLTNNINDMNVYEWMMKRREEINYKDIDFHDPIAPNFWLELHNEICQYGIKSVLDKIANDKWLYCFQEEYAILGIPTKRLILTVNEINKLRENINIDISEEKKVLIDNISVGLSEYCNRELKLWEKS